MKCFEVFSSGEWRIKGERSEKCLSSVGEWRQWREVMYGERMYSSKGRMKTFIYNSSQLNLILEALVIDQFLPIETS